MLAELLPLGRAEHLGRDGRAILPIEKRRRVTAPPDEPAGDQPRDVQEPANAEPGPRWAAADRLARPPGQRGTEPGLGPGLVEREGALRQADERDRRDGVAQRRPAAGGVPAV